MVEAREREGSVYGSANLDVEPADGVAVVHCVKRSDFVHAHRRHFEQARDLVHDADAREAVLALAEVEQGHHGGFFVLRRVAFEDFGDEFLVDGVEGEGDGGVVDGGVTVLFVGERVSGGDSEARFGGRTTARASDERRVVVVRWRHWGMRAV